MTWLRDNNTHLNAPMFTHPITGMKYKKVSGEYFYRSRSLNFGEETWIKSGMKTGFIPSLKP